MISRFGASARRVRKHAYLLQDIRNYVENKEIIGICPMDTTKLELVNFILKVVTDVNGNIYITGKDIKARYFNRLEPSKKVLENIEIQKELSGMENIEIALKKNRKKMTEEIDDYIEALELGNIIHKSVSEYNKVQLQNLDIVRSAIFGSNIIILDEPECLEDLKSKKSFRKTMDKLLKVSDIHIFFISDDPSRLTQNCNKIIHLEDAMIESITVLGPYKKVKEKETVKD